MWFAKKGAIRNPVIFCAFFHRRSWSNVQLCMGPLLVPCLHLVFVTEKCYHFSLHCALQQMLILCYSCQNMEQIVPCFFTLCCQLKREIIYFDPWDFLISYLNDHLNCCLLLFFVLCKLEHCGTIKNVEPILALIADHNKFYLTTKYTGNTETGNRPKLTS